MEKKINELITKLCELHDAVVKLIKAVYLLKQEIDNEKKMRTDNKKLFT